ncbi:MAG: hypothetical protein JO051_00835 [Acidobacteriaceae bacterium]|nr:hypothetical protein [Acidobacteriaceae bacterium]
MAENRDAGELPEERKKKRVSEKPVLPTLSEMGVDKNLADRARKYAAIPAEEFEAILPECRLGELVALL